MDKSDLAELVKLSLKELQSKRKISVGEEKAAFQAVQAAGDQWTVCAAQTMLLDRAIEYVQTPEVPHTANEWKPIKDGQMEISNLVYVMRYKISQQKDGNHKGQWLVTWGIAINCPPRPKTEKYYYAGDVMVVDVKKKYYNGEADAQHYIQGRFDVYAHLFTELSPPVPDKYKRHFQINGVLLPGYTVAPPERAPHEVADELPFDRHLLLQQLIRLLAELILRYIGVAGIPAAPPQIAEHFRNPPLFSRADFFFISQPRECPADGLCYRICLTEQIQWLIYLVFSAYIGGHFQTYIRFRTAGHICFKFAPYHWHKAGISVFAFEKCNLCESRYMRTISVADIADRVGISRTHLNHVFQKETNLSVQNYLMDFRMQKAASLLTDTAMAVKEISHQVGYSDPLVFSKAFKRKFGISPKQYRAYKDELEQRDKRP